LRNTCNFKT